jgi:hypothetical protein
MHLYSGDYIVHFVNIDDPKDTASVSINAHAADNGDKAPGKAASYATKYAMLKMFSLETGENDEQRFADPYTQEQHDTYHELLETDKAYEFYMFNTSLPQETSTGLNNSFPDGKKVSGKKSVKEMNDKGYGLFMGVVENIQTRLAAQDISVIEVTDEMTSIEKSMLVRRLAKHEVEQLKKIKDASI